MISPFSQVANSSTPLFDQGFQPPANRLQKGKRRKSKVDPDCPGNDAADYARYSSDSQREESISDQQRKCAEFAEQNGHRILPEFEYSDEAVSGTKLRRKGLDAMLRDAEVGEFKTLYVYSLSRLSRESVITMPMLKHLVYVLKIRFISVTEGIDSNRDGWDVIASIMALMHEQYIKELSANVLRGQEGALLASYCVGDYRFGYTSEPILGSEVNRRGREAKPRKMYVIDELTAPWVIRIFHWFVNERQSLRWITRVLNRRNAPKDHRSSTEHWHHQQVAGLLACTKYIGIWEWGIMKNTRDPLTGKVRQELRPEDESEKWKRDFPHLKIIDEKTFEEAQCILQANYEKHVANRRDDGTMEWSKSGNAFGPPRHLLSKLIICGECGSNFYVGGSGGKYLFCPNYHKGTCTCKTQLRRDRGERMILDEIGKRILSCPEWLQAVYEVLIESWNDIQQRVPSELMAAEKAVADVDRKISRLVDRIEGGFDDPDIKQRLCLRRDERRELSKGLKKLQLANRDIGPTPTKEWLNLRLQQLGECLHGDTPAAAYALRDLVGGQIVVSEIRHEGRQRHYLHGKFSISVTSIVNVVTGAASDGIEEPKSVDELSEQIEIDFVEANPLDAEAEAAKALYDQNMLNKEIAKELGCSKSKVTKLIRHWFKSRGLDMPDGRTRRSDLEQKHVEPPLYQKISEEVKRLYDQRMLLGEIAQQLKVDRNTVTSSTAYWYKSRGMEAPDGRARRKTLSRKVSHKDQT